MVSAVTGHRPDKLWSKDPYSDDNLELLVGFAEIVVQKFLTTKILTGMALGWDMACALACINLDMPYVAVVPCKGQESKWPAKSQKRYKYLLTKACEIVEVSKDEYTPGCMQKRNRYLVDNASTVLALYNGTPGGTQDCVELAQRAKVPVQNYWLDWQHYLKTYGPGR